MQLITAGFVQFLLQKVKILGFLIWFPVKFFSRVTICPDIYSFGIVFDFRLTTPVEITDGAVAFFRAGKELNKKLYKEALHLLDADRQEKLQLKHALAVAAERNNDLANQVEAVCSKSHRRIRVLNDLLDEQDKLLRSALKQNVALRHAESGANSKDDVVFARKLVEEQASKNRLLAQKLMEDADSFTKLAMHLGN